METFFKQIKCLSCGYEADCHAALGRSIEVTGIVKGDLSICANCGQISEFDDDLNMAPIGKNTLSELLLEDPKLYNILSATSQLIIERKIKKQ